MAYLVITEPGQEPKRCGLDGRLTIGRAADCDLILDDHSLSRHHCRIDRVDKAGTAWSIVDLDSRNGTWVKGRRVTEKMLEDEDQVHLGDVTLIYHASGVVAERPPGPKPPTEEERLRQALLEELNSSGAHKLDTSKMPRPAPKVAHHHATTIRNDPVARRDPTGTPEPVPLAVDPAGETHVGKPMAFARPHPRLDEDVDEDARGGGRKGNRHGGRQSNHLVAAGAVIAVVVAAVLWAVLH